MDVLDVMQLETIQKSGTEPATRISQGMIGLPPSWFGDLDLVCIIWGREISRENGANRERRKELNLLAYKM